MRVSGSRREEMAKEMADAAREAAEQKARSELGSLQGKFDIYFCQTLGSLGSLGCP